MSRWGAHWCLLDADCRRWGAPNRIHLFTPHWVVIIGIGWDNRIQAWVPWKGHLEWWWPIVVHPRSDRDVTKSS